MLKQDPPVAMKRCHRLCFLFLFPHPSSLQKHRSGVTGPGRGSPIVNWSFQLNRGEGRKKMGTMGSHCLYSIRRGMDSLKHITQSHTPDMCCRFAQDKFSPGACRACMECHSAEKLLPHISLPCCWAPAERYFPSSIKG